MSETAEGREPRHTEFWSLLDWCLWGAGMADVFREPIADKMFAALTAEEREQAEALIVRWHQYRDPVGRRQYEALKAERDSAERQCQAAEAELDETRQRLTQRGDDLRRTAEMCCELRWLHAEAVWRVDGMSIVVKKLAEWHKLLTWLHAESEWKRGQDRESRFRWAEEAAQVTADRDDLAKRDAQFRADVDIQAAAVHADLTRLRTVLGLSSTEGRVDGLTALVDVIAARLAGRGES